MFMMIVIKVVLGLLAVWFGLLGIFRGSQYFGLIESEDSYETGFPHIGFGVPFKQFIIDSLITVLIIVIIVIL